ncbi:MAG: hypothetical protein AAB638_03415, partial [Patescibacteria group bacterium]
RKIISNDGGVYLYILFPVAVAFLITFGIARLISHLHPLFFIQIVSGLHIHHFAYGILILALAGYLALINDKPRNTYLISLLYGFGLGLAFDEFGMWLRLSDESAARWSYDGVVVLIAFFILLISAESGSKMWRRHFGPKEVIATAVLTEKTEVFEAPPTP